MRKNEVSTEERVTNIVKRTASDINQLFSEINAELSEEYLKNDDLYEAKHIKAVLNIISDQQDAFLAAIKKAVSTLKGEETRSPERSYDDDDDEDFDLQVINESK